MYASSSTGARVFGNTFQHSSMMATRNDTSTWQG